MHSFSSITVLCLFISSMLVLDANAAVLNFRHPHRPQVVAASTNNTSTSDACTQARLNILVSLIVSEDATSKINSTDPATQSAVQAAEQGFALTFTGVSAIARAILTNQSASEDARNQVGQGILDVKNALLSINGTDASDANLAEAKQTIDLAVAASNDVVKNCK